MNRSFQRWTCAAAAVVALASAFGGRPASAASGGAAPGTGQARGRTEGRTALPGGVILRYVEQGPGGAQTVIFLHGYTDSAVSFEEVLDRLSPAIHAIAIDQRGHGASARPGCCYTMEQLADDVAAFMEARGLRSATLVGHSMGGVVAQLAALRHPARVKALVLSATAPSFRGPAVDETVAAVRALQDPIDRTFAHDFQASTVYRPLPPERLERYVDESMKLPARTWKALAESLAATDLRPRLRDLRIPTLIVWGDRDGFVGREFQQELVEGIRGARLIVYEDTGHAIHWEAPERFVRDLEAFLRMAS